MDASALSLLRELLRLPGSRDLINDASVLSCGCLVSERGFLTSNSKSCFCCNMNPVHILKPVPALRSLYEIVASLEEETKRQDPPSKSTSSSRGKHTRLSDFSPRSGAQASLSTPELDFLGLFRKFARDELPVRQYSKVQTKSSSFSQLLHMDDEPSIESLLPPKPQVQQSLIVSSKQSNSELPESQSSEIDDGPLPLLGENEELFFSSCFPFHRKASMFATQQGKSPFSTRSLIKQRRLTGSAMHSYFDKNTNSEVTLFCLISDKKWELFRYGSEKPTLIACGRSTGEFGKTHSSCAFPDDNGLVAQNQFSESAPIPGETSGSNSLNHKLKSWVMLRCKLTESFLVISGTTGIMRIFNVNSNNGQIGQPVYTYTTDFPIRCIAIAPNNKLIACGITAKEKSSNKQQPFIILHNLTESEKGENLARVDFKTLCVSAMTITVPFRDPLKILNFNASSTHLICSTVYEMRFFIIRLLDDSSPDYKRPRLIYSDTRLVKTSRDGYNTKSDEQSDDLDQLLGTEDDAQMLDNEGITDIIFGQSSSNTIIITSSSMKNKPSVVLKINGPSIDFKGTEEIISRKNLDAIGASFISTSAESNPEPTLDITILMKLNDIGSNIYGAKASPRGDSILFTDKMGRLLLVATRSGFMNSHGSKPIKSAVVLLGEVAPALRYTEAASVCFSSDGGRIMAVDRKGIFRVFDFTKGLPGEDPEVTKCKILSVW